MFRLEDLHLELLNFGSDTVLSRIAQDQTFFDRSLEGVVKHHMDTAHSGIAQSGFLLFLYLSQSAIAL